MSPPPPSPPPPPQPLTITTISIITNEEQRQTQKTTANHSKQTNKISKHKRSRQQAPHRNHRQKSRQRREQEGTSKAKIHSVALDTQRARFGVEVCGNRHIGLPPGGNNHFISACGHELRAIFAEVAMISMISLTGSSLCFKQGL